MKLFLNRCSFCVCVLILANNISAQDAANPQFLKTPVSVEIADQPGNPLHVSLTGVDISNERSQRINITIQNLSEKSIRGYVLTSSPQAVGTIQTSFFPRKAFVSGSIHGEQLNIVNENIRSDDVKVTIAIDYVLFTDQTGWGEDKEKKSDSILGQISGTRAAGAGVVGFIKGSGMTGLERLLPQVASETFVRIDPGNQDRSASWQAGYRTGYRAVINFVQQHYTNPDFLSQLEEATKDLE